MSQEEGEASKAGSAIGDSDALNVIGQAFVKMNELTSKLGRKMDEDKKATADTINLLANKLESLQLMQIQSMESQRQTIQTPLPKYDGKMGKFDDWKQGVLCCIKNNGWTDEKRILEMLPSALSGQAAKAFMALSTDEKETLNTTMASLKQALDPRCKEYNRELFIRSKRGPGESMRAFVGRCNEYIMRADELEAIEDSPWAIPFIVEKIYANLSSFDRKILKSGAGDCKNVQYLAMKADELLAEGEDIVGAALNKQNGRNWYQHRQPWEPNNRYQWSYPQYPIYWSLTAPYRRYQPRPPPWGVRYEPWWQQNNCYQGQVYQQERQPNTPGSWSHRPYVKELDPGEARH